MPACSQIPEFLVQHCRTDDSCAEKQNQIQYRSSRKSLRGNVENVPLMEKKTNCVGMTSYSPQTPSATFTTSSEEPQTYPALERLQSLVQILDLAQTSSYQHRYQTPAERERKRLKVNAGEEGREGFCR